MAKGQWFVECAAVALPPQTPAGGTYPSGPPVKVSWHAPDEASGSPCQETVAAAVATYNGP